MLSAKCPPFFSGPILLTHLFQDGEGNDPASDKLKQSSLNDASLSEGGNSVDD